MNNDNEWNEIQKWENKRKEQEFDKYGINISEIDLNKTKKKMNKFMILIHSTNFTAIFGILFIVFIIISILAVNYENFVFMTINSKIEKEMNQKYDLNVSIWSKVKYENEKYYKFKMYSNDNEKIEFTAIDKDNKIVDDYINRRHKYFFEKWQGRNKSNFVVSSYENNDLLAYETYIEDFENLENAIENIIEFASFCNDKYISEWSIYLNKNGKKYYPLKNRDFNKDNILKDAKKFYNLK